VGERGRALTGKGARVVRKMGIWAEMKGRVRAELAEGASWDRIGG
jgi:hypothetical protein